MTAGSLPTSMWAYCTCSPSASLGVYGIIMAGWASNSKYPFLGALRSAAQMVSYEVSIGFVIITVLLAVGSLNLSDVVRAQENLWFFIPLFPMFIVFVVSALAETNRSPFDLPEAEAELVSGYNVEYSAMAFALFMLGEYANMILMSGMTTVLFLGGWLPPFDIAPFNWLPGVIWFALKVAFRLVCVPVGSGHGAAVPLRSADAAWLEGIPAVLIVVGRADRWRAARVRLVAGVSGYGFCRSIRARPSAGRDCARPRAHLPLHVQAAGDTQLSVREGTDQPAVPRRACLAALPERRGALHRL